jgi:hypothetical protein
MFGVMGNFDFRSGILGSIWGFAPVIGYLIDPFIPGDGSDFVKIGPLALTSMLQIATFT